MTGKTPVALLTGFLGSGKTTLLSRLLAQGGFKDTAVIVNEFGEISIDHLVVADLAENILELRDGCLCCTIRGDLVMTLRDLNRRRYLEEIPSFSRVIVETTGLADPVPLVHTMMANAPIMTAYKLDAVICVLDGEHGLATLSEHDTAQDQVAMADILVISKVDVAARDTLDALHARIAGINAGAEVVEVANGEIDATHLFGRALFQPEARGACRLDGRGPCASRSWCTLRGARHTPQRRTQPGRYQRISQSRRQRNEGRRIAHQGHCRVP